MRIGKLEFKPGILPSIATALGILLLVSMGNWQLRRAEEKRAMQHALEAQLQVPALRLLRMPADPLALRYRRVEITGSLDGAHQVLLDNQVYQGRAGYQVYTPMQVEGGDVHVLIARGWIEQGASRAQLPEVTVPTQAVSLHGRLNLPPAGGIQLGEEVVSSEWPRVLARVDFPYLEQALGYPLLPMVVQLDADAPHGYTRDWPLYESGMGPERHQGYAVQWYGLGAALLIIYLAANVRRVRTAAPDNEGEGQ